MTDKEKKSKIADILMEFQETYDSDVINRPMIASIYAGEVLSFIDSLREVPCNNCQGFNDKDKCDELVFGKSCPLQKRNNSELTEFEKEVKGLLFDAGDKYDLNTDLDKATKDLAPHFLEAARKQFVEEACNWLYDMWPQIAESPQFIEDFRKALEKGVKDDIK